MINKLNQKFTDSQKALMDKMNVLLTLPPPTTRSVRRETFSIKQENSSTFALNRRDGKQKQKEVTVEAVGNAEG